MSYQSIDRSTEDGAPVEFYRFIGAFGEFCYTSDTVPGVCDGIEYEPLSIERTSIEVGSVVDSPVTMDFMLPADDQLALLYCYRRTPDMLTVEVRRAHRGGDWDTEFDIEWIGYGLDTSVNGEIATLKTGSILQAMLNNNVASIYYQRMCNHTLFDTRCKVLKEDWTYGATVTKVQNQIITLDNDGAADNDLVGGQLRNVRTGEVRLIYTNQNNLLTISFPFLDLRAGDAVEVTFGCDHLRLGHCKNRFNNVPNYGGFDHIPSVNPFEDLHFESLVVETLKQRSETVIPANSGNVTRR